MDRNGNSKTTPDDTSTAFEEIYARYSRRIYDFMATRFRDRETARDLTQEVFAQFIRTDQAVSRIREGPAAYLYGIAKHVVADFLNRRESEPFRRDPVDLERIGARFKEDAVGTLGLEKCFKRLNRDDRTILTLRFWMGKSHAEIAARVGMTHDQTRQRFHRALAALKMCLEGGRVSQKRPKR